MILGMSLPTFTLLHVVISLVGIATGFVVAFGLWNNRALPSWRAIFLATTILTSATGFLFPSTKFGGPHIFGVISLVLLLPCVLAVQPFAFAGPWRWIYVVTAMIAQYLNVFVLVVQSFQKIPFLNALAPQGTEPPFAIAQGAVFLLFVLLTVMGVRRFHPGRIGAERASPAVA